MMAICRNIGYGYPFFGSPQLVRVIEEQDYGQKIETIYVVEWWHPIHEEYKRLEKLKSSLEFLDCIMEAL